MAIIILNEQHTLLPAQVEILDQVFGSGRWQIQPIPADGLNLRQQDELSSELTGDIVFASPIPVLLARIAAARAVDLERWRVSDDENDYKGGCIAIFHNDRRVAREVPDGKGGVRVIHTVASDGWQLVTI